MLEYIKFCDIFTYLNMIDFLRDIDHLAFVTFPAFGGEDIARKSHVVPALDRFVLLKEEDQAQLVPVEEQALASLTPNDRIHPTYFKQT